MLNKQAAFNRAGTGLFRQKQFSTMPIGPCLYRGPNSTKCAIGWLIPDRAYDPDIEEQGVDCPSVVECISSRYTDGELTDDDESFLGNMQNQIHDNLSHQAWDDEVFLSAARDFARDYRLTMPKELQNV